jgi:hypothetical protein
MPHPKASTPEIGQPLAGGFPLGQRTWMQIFVTCPIHCIS